MRSMTGFGRGVVERNGTRVTAEVRALNQRFFELKAVLPRGWGEQEAEIRKKVQTVVARGRVELFIKAVALKPPRARLEVNENLANLYVKELRRVGKNLKLNGDLSIEVILNRPEIFHVVEEESEPTHAIELGMKALKEALRRLDAERVREGQSLHKDFVKRIAAVGNAIPKIEQLAEKTRADIRANFEKRVREL
ncbi:MAG TPA: YicC/YloC family endoribonuclease, partial [Candidatus Binataceae bacterium]|nr:YicC/YloC family endoribonuclease [Candidatus Binataceae bacterium]